MDGRRPLILMSGGLDSTYLAYRLAREGKSFDTLYVDGGQVQYKTIAEKLARQQIIEYLTDTFKISIIERSTHSVVRYGNTPAAGFCQFMPWFVSAMESVDPDRHSCVQMGYITGDQIVSKVPGMIQAWDALWPICKNHVFKVPLVLPLIDEIVSKVSILRKIPKELYRMTWVCELPEQVPLEDDFEYHPCGKCLACIGREVENYRLQLLTGEQMPLDRWMLAKHERRTTEKYRDGEESVTQLIKS